MIICNTFRIPYAFVGGIYALVVARDSPRATLNSAGTILLLAGGGLAYVLVSVQFVVSVPALHFLWTIASLFLAFYVLAVVTNYGAFVCLALLIAIAVTIWDRHVSAETNVEDTLWLSLAALIALVVTSGIELAFKRIRPGDDIVVRSGARWIGPPKKRSSGWACLEHQVCGVLYGDLSIRPGTGRR
jgi:multidrug resistance protein MdtO